MDLYSTNTAWNLLMLLDLTVSCSLLFEPVLFYYHIFSGYHFCVPYLCIKGHIFTIFPGSSQKRHTKFTAVDQNMTDKGSALQSSCPQSCRRLSMLLWAVARMWLHCNGRRVNSKPRHFLQQKGMESSTSNYLLCNKQCQWSIEGVFLP